MGDSRGPQNRPNPHGEPAAIRFNSNFGFAGFGLPLRNAMLLNRPLTVSFNGYAFFLEPRGAIAGDIWAGLRCESQEVSFILNVLEPGMIFFDVGANAGLFAISAAKKIGGKGVFAFEPCSSTCELLKRNLQVKSPCRCQCCADCPGGFGWRGHVANQCQRKRRPEHFGQGDPSRQQSGRPGKSSHHHGGRFYEGAQCSASRCHESGYRGRGTDAVSRSAGICSSAPTRR